jgi:hypothetical protein
VGSGKFGVAVGWDEGRGDAQVEDTTDYYTRAYRGLLLPRNLMRLPG